MLAILDQNAVVVSDVTDKPPGKLFDIVVVVNFDLEIGGSKRNSQHKKQLCVCVLLNTGFLRIIRKSELFIRFLYTPNILL